MCNEVKYSNSNKECEEILLDIRLNFFKLMSIIH